MIEKIFFIVVLFLFMSCKDTEQSHNDLIRIPVNINEITKDPSSFLEKIEIVPLETNDSNLFDIPSSIFYDKKSDMYVLMSDMDVFTFTGKGKSIGNSIKKRGQGPEEYSFIVDMKYNHFMNGIDLLNPYGIIYTYSPTFELISRRKFKPEFPVSYIMPLDSSNYVFKYASIWVDQEIGFLNLKTGNINHTNYKGMISAGNGLEHPHFHTIDNNLYFIPQGIDYYIYQIDASKKRISPIMYLDFGKEEITENELPGRAFGKRVNNTKERKDIVKAYSDRHNYLRRSEKYVIPMQKFFNNNYVYIFIKKGKEMWHYIYNQLKKKGYLIKNNVPICMYPCFSIDENVLLACCQPTELSMVIDRRFMTQQQIELMENIKEDDNSIIIKYYLKK